MIAACIDDLVRSAIHALAYVVFTVFLGWLFMPEELLP